MRKLDVFGETEDDDNKTSNSKKSLFDLLNEDEDDDLNLDLQYSESLKENTEQAPPKKVGTFDKSDFEPTLNISNNVERIVSTKNIRYEDFKKKPVEEEQVEEVKPMDVFNEIPGYMQDNNVESNKDKMKRKLSDTLKSVGLTANKRNQYRDDLNIKYIPNHVIIKDLQNIYCTDNMIQGDINGEPISFELLGFTTNFDCVFKVKSEASILTGGSTKLFTSGMNTYLLNEVYMFEQGENVQIAFNKNNFILNFRENNKRNRSVKGMSYYEVDSIVINELIE